MHSLPAGEQVMSVSKLGWMEKIGNSYNTTKDSCLFVKETDSKGRGKPAPTRSPPRPTSNAGPTATTPSHFLREKFDRINVKSPNFFNVGSLFIIFKTLRDNSVYAESNTYLDQKWPNTGSLQPLTYNIQSRPPSLRNLQSMGLYSRLTLASISRANALLV